jgi:hypothetical protein
MDFINEHSFYVDLIPFKHFGFGLCIGDIYDNPEFDPRPLSSSQNNKPGTVYKGYVGRLYFSYYFFNRDFKKTKFGFYLSPQIIYKNLYYNNKTFFDASPQELFGQNSTKNTITYTRNEKANIIGCDLNCGMFISLRIIKPSIYLYINPYLGLGYNKKSRNIETLSIVDNDYLGDKPILGNELKNTNYITILMGVKIGILFSI